MALYKFRIIVIIITIIIIVIIKTASTVGLRDYRDNWPRGPVTTAVGPTTTNRTQTRVYIVPS